MSNNKTAKIVSLAILLAAGIHSSYAQQDPQYTQYMYNPQAINPAAAGTSDALSIFGHYRMQWAGIDGAPKTANLAVSTPLGDSGLGLGATFTSDKIGAMSDNNISIDLSYSIELNRFYKLAFGLKGTANLLDVNYTDLQINKPIFRENISNKFTPNIGAGVYLYSDRAYLGLSVPNFLTTERYDDNEYSTMRQRAHFNLMGGYVFDLNDNIKLKPAFLAKAVSGAPLQVDLSANFLFMEKLTVGASYRVDAAVSGLVGFQVTRDIFVGYSYDAETSKLANYNSGSHEFLLRFDIRNRKQRISTPRFF